MSVNLATLHIQLSQDNYFSAAIARGNHLFPFRTQQ